MIVARGRAYIVIIYSYRAYTQRTAAAGPRPGRSKRTNTDCPPIWGHAPLFFETVFEYFYSRGVTRTPRSFVLAPYSANIPGGSPPTIPTRGAGVCRDSAK